MRKLLGIGIILLLFAVNAYGQTKTLMPVPNPQFLDSSGDPLALGHVHTFIAGTTTPQATYTDSTGNTLNANPVVLDAGGFADSGGIWLTPTLSYKFQVDDSDNVLQYTVDVVRTALLQDASGAVTAGSVIFGGTGGIIAQDNSNLFFDDSNNRLGIGTATPATTLDVTGTINSTVGYQDTGAAPLGNVLVGDGTTFVSNVSPLENFDSILLVDDFPTNTINGQLGWGFDDIAGTGSSPDLAAGFFDHPGLYGIQSGGTTNNASSIFLGSDADGSSITSLGDMSTNTGWDSTFIIRTGSSVASIEYAIGFSDASVTNPSDQIIVRFIAGTDTNWVYETCKASSCTTSTASGIPPVADTFYRFRIRSTSAGSILFSIDGGSETTISDEVPTVDMGPLIFVKTLTSAAKTILVDFFSYKATVSR